MRPNMIAAGSLLTVLLNTVAWGQALRPSAEVLDPFVTAQTVLVAHADLTKANVPELEKFVWAIIQKGIEGDAEMMAAQKTLQHGEFLKLQERAEQFTQAGGRDVYLVAEMANASPTVSAPVSSKGQGVVHVVEEHNALTGPVRVLIPFYGEDAGTLMVWIDEYFPGQAKTEVVGKTVVVSLVDQPQQSPLKPSARPELQQAMASVGAAPLSVMLIPTDANRKLIEKMMPTLPPPVGGPATALTRGVKWASLAVELPPKLDAKLVIQSQDAAAAEAMRGVIERGLGAWAEMGEKDAGLANAGELVKPLLPTQQADKLTLSLGQAQVDRFVVGVAPAIRLARQRATEMASMSNIRQMLMACIIYSNDHRGQWPATLEAATGTMPASLLTNPSRPKAKPAYIYMKPANAKKLPNESLVLYEAFDRWPGLVNVGFADGHVERIDDQQRFEQLLKAAGK